MANRTNLTTLTFQGERFRDGGLDLDVLPDLIAYKRLLVETAKEIWRRSRPERERLPKGYEVSVRLKFFEVRTGSAVIPIVRELPSSFDPMLAINLHDEVDEAASVLEESVAAAISDGALPAGLPKVVLPLFEEFGRSLLQGESISMQASKRKGAPAIYTPTVRDRLSAWHDPKYQDSVVVSGEVRAADLDGHNFVVRTDRGIKVPARIRDGSENLVTDALDNHLTRRVTVSGLGEFGAQDGDLRRIVRVDRIEAHDLGEATRPEGGGAPNWNALLSLGSALSAEEWAAVPRDGSATFHAHLHGGTRGNREER